MSLTISRLPDPSFLVNLVVRPTRGHQMARRNPSVIGALRQTARSLAKSEDYQWGHMGSCNCGFLAREITNLDKKQIHAYAMQRYGDWNEQLNDYCPASGWPMDGLISELINFGFDTDDLKNLERLSDRTILDSLPEEKRKLYFNVKQDVVIYLNAWASLLEEEYIKQVQLTDLCPQGVV